MSLLTAAFREQVKKTKDIAQQSEMTYSISYPTGFLNLDFANGFVQTVGGVPRFELGFTDGSINMIISDSGLGKTTLASQIACNMVRNFRTSAIFYEEAEVGTNIERIRRLSGFTEEEFKNRFIIRDAGITIESIYERAKMIHDIKIANPDEYTYDTGIKDPFGKSVIKYEPTIMILDSLKLISRSSSVTMADAVVVQSVSSESVYSGIKTHDSAEACRADDTA